MITLLSVPERSTILEKSQRGGWPPCNGRLTAPLLCMIINMFIINISLLPRAFGKYFIYFPINNF